MVIVPISNTEENYQTTWLPTYPIPFHGEGRENFVAQIVSGKMMMFSCCRALAKAWSDMNKYHWKEGQEEKENHTSSTLIVIYHIKNAIEAYCMLKM